MQSGSSELPSSGLTTAKTGESPCSTLPQGLPLRTRMPSAISSLQTCHTRTVWGAW